ncbi:MAG: hypothetical protein FWF68_08510 [Spirochaetes bacterium]|nr:hypothetical protein [Spirochaetota bacterium]
MPIIIKMYPGGLFALIKDVISSWQVIAVTLAMLLFLKIVFYVSASYRRPIKIKKLIPKKKPKPEPAAANPDEIHEEAGGSANEELGLKEE